jgi:G:T-mismatch repair DNA endonuclease (very short patch repair protein)
MRWAMQNYKNYFIFSYQIKNNIPKFSIKLNLALFENKEKPFFLKNGKKIPITSSSLQYFNYYCNNKEMAINLYEFRKKFFNQFSIYKELIDSISENDNEIIKCYFDNIKIKEKTNHELVIRSEHYLSNLKNAATKNKELRSKKMIERYKDPEFRRELIRNLHSDEAKKKRIKKFKETMSKSDIKNNFLLRVRNKNRTESISNSGKRRWASLSDEEKMQILQNLRYKKKFLINEKKMNLNEYIVANILNDIDLKWEYEKKLKSADRYLLPDFIIEDLKIAIECYGTYWHADPNIFNHNDIFFKKISAMEIWKRDEDRIKKIKDLGYKVFIFWENTIHSDPEYIKQTILRSIK